MPSYRRGGGGGGGSGFALGPEQNSFGASTTARAAAEAARTTYATANAAWLAEYNGNRSFYIRLVFTGNAVAFQRRNAAGTAWEDVTGIVTGPRGTSGAALALSSADPEAPGTAAAGTATLAARGDHVHPQDDEKADLASPALTGTPTAPTPTSSSDDGQIATKEYVDDNAGGGGDGGSGPSLSDDDPEASGTASAGTGTEASRSDHVHPQDDEKADLDGADFTGAVSVASSSGGPLEVDGTNAGNSTIMKIFTPDSGTQKAFGAGRQGEFDWVQFAGEVVSGKPGFALGPGTARDTNLYREEADHLKTDDDLTVAGDLVVEGAASGETPTVDAHFATKAYVDANAGSGGGLTQAQVNALIQTALAAAVTGNTETGITVTYNADGTLDFAVATTPAQTHLNYIAISADNAFAAGEFTAAATGNSSMSSSLVVPTFAGVSRFIGIAVPDARGDITDILQGGVSTFGAWVRITGTVTIGGEAHKVWRTVDAQNDLASGLTYVIVQ